MTMPYTTLISAADLAQQRQPDWVVLDCRHDLADPQAGRAAYDAGHVPGALFASLDDDLADHARAADGSFRGRHPLPSIDAFIATLRRWGVNDDSQVVAYDAQGGMFAARLWWMLRWAGHRAVAVLDGGLPAWTALGLPMTTEVPTPAPAYLQQRPPLVRTVSANDIIAQPQLKVLDARAPDRFRGENETLDPVGGHIPGAANRFFKDNLLPDGHFKPAAQLRAELDKLVADPASSVMQCGSGVTACHNLLALEVAGLPGAALYPGSWSEWCSDPSRPVATGA
jgi:thiosulfate/3-mercaptopyruvate sulfurtransferase